LVIFKKICIGHFIVDWRNEELSKAFKALNNFSY
jgi:hypothetical protein